MADYSIVTPSTVTLMHRKKCNWIVFIATDCKFKKKQYYSLCNFIYLNHLGFDVNGLVNKMSYANPTVFGGVDGEAENAVNKI